MEIARPFRTGISSCLIAIFGVASAMTARSADDSGVALDVQPATRGLIPLWQRKLPATIEWAVVRDSSGGPFVAILTTEPRIFPMDAFSGEDQPPIAAGLDPGSRAVQANSATPTVLDVLGRFSLTSIWPEFAPLQANTVGRFRIAKFACVSMGEPLDSGRDAAGDPEYLKGILAAARNRNGLLVAGKSRALHWLDGDRGATIATTDATGDIQRMTCDDENWALLTREHGRYGVMFVQAAAPRSHVVQTFCDLDDNAPQWFEMHGGAAVCVSPAVLDVIRPGGFWARFFPRGGGRILASATCAATDCLGRSLVLVADLAGYVAAIDVAAGVELWRRQKAPSDAGVRMLANDRVVVCITDTRADVIDLLSGAACGAIALSAEEHIQGAMVHDGLLYAVMRRVRGNVETGNVRAWRLSDCSPAGAGEFPWLGDGAMAVLRPHLLLCYSNRDIMALAIDFP